jgi:hypothetical protein
MYILNQLDKERGSSEFFPQTAWVEISQSFHSGGAKEPCKCRREIVSHIGVVRKPLLAQL